MSNAMRFLIEVKSWEEMAIGHPRLGKFGGGWRQVDRQMDRQNERRIDRQRNIYRERDRKTEKVKRKRERKRERENSEPRLTE